MPPGWTDSAKWPSSLWAMGLTDGRGFWAEALGCQNQVNGNGPLVAGHHSRPAMLICAENGGNSGLDT